MRCVAPITASLCAGQGVPFQGRMRMGVIPTVAPYLLPGLLGQIRSQYPDFKLFIREDLSQPLVDALLSGALDVLLLALPFPAEQVETMPLFEDDFLLACPPDHPLASRSPLRSADLTGESLLLLRGLGDHARCEACAHGPVTGPASGRRLESLASHCTEGGPCRARAVPGVAQRGARPARGGSRVERALRRMVSVPGESRSNVLDGPAAAARTQKMNITTLVNLRALCAALDRRFLRSSSHHRAPSRNALTPHAPPLRSLSC